VTWGTVGVLSISYLAKYVLMFLHNYTTDDLLSTLLYYGCLQVFLYCRPEHRALFGWIEVWWKPRI